MLNFIMALGTVSSEQCFDYTFPKYVQWDMTQKTELMAMDVSDEESSYLESSIIYGGKYGDPHYPYLAMRKVGSNTKLEWLVDDAE